MDDKYLIIRGKRVADLLEGLQLSERSTSKELIFERSSIDQLRTKTKNFTPQGRRGDREASSKNINIVGNVTMLPFVGTKTLQVQALVHSDVTTTAGGPYNTTIIFNKIEYDAEDAPDNITFTAKDGKEYHMKQNSLANVTCRVRCNCLDFYWRFAHYNSKDQSLVGKSPPPYQRISNLGPVNPQKVPGLCKHLIATFAAIDHSGLVVNAPTKPEQKQIKQPTKAVAPTKQPQKKTPYKNVPDWAKPHVNKDNVAADQDTDEFV